ncbi:MFS transporter [Erwinia sp. CPCC 100877]|nr:MFS transporter [Erwinia sp. CPCC 100877]
MKKGKIFYGWKILVVCTLITCLMVPPVVGVASRFVVPVTTSLGISRSTFAMSNTIVQAIGIFLSPLVSRKLASGDLKKIQTLSIAGFAIALASYGFAQNAVSLYISSFFVGLFYIPSTFLPVTFVITNWFELHRGLAMSIAMAGIGLGGFIYSPVVTFLLTQVGWRGTYQVMGAAIAVIVLPSVFFIIRKNPSDLGLEPLKSEARPEEKSSESKEQVMSMQSAQTKSFFFLFLIGMLLNGIINNGAIGNFAPAMEDKFGIGVATAVVSLYSLIGVGGKIFLGWLNDKYGLAVSIVFGCGMFGASFIFLTLGNGITSAYLMAIAFGLGLGIGTVTPPLVTSAVFGQKNYAQAYGIGNSFLQIGMAVGSLLIAFSFDQTGSYDFGWFLLLALTILTAICWLYAYNRSKIYQKTTDELRQTKAVEVD